jgi:hypothetical protein
MFSKLFKRSGEKTGIKAFANELASQLARRYPPEIDRRQGSRPSVNRLTRIMEDACARAVDYQQEHRLGWLGKSRLGNDFRWALRDLGYTDQFVDFATEAVVIHLSRKKPGASTTAQG